MPAAGSCALLSALKRRRFGRRRRLVYAEPVDGAALRAVDVAAMGRVHGSVAYVARRRRGGAALAAAVVGLRLRPVLGWAFPRCCSRQSGPHSWAGHWARRGKRVELCGVRRSSAWQCRQGGPVRGWRSLRDLAGKLDRGWGWGRGCMVWGKLLVARLCGNGGGGVNLMPGRLSEPAHQHGASVRAVLVDDGTAGPGQ